MLGKKQQCERRRSGFALVAVNQDGRAAIVVLRSEQKELHKRLDLEERDRGIDDVEVQIVRVSQNQVVRVLGRKAALIADGSLVAWRLARVHDSEFGRTRPARAFIRDKQPLVNLSHLFFPSSVGASAATMGALPASRMISVKSPSTVADSTRLLAVWGSRLAKIRLVHASYRSGKRAV